MTPNLKASIQAAEAYLKGMSTAQKSKLWMKGRYLIPLPHVLTTTEKYDFEKHFMDKDKFNFHKILFDNPPNARDEDKNLVNTTVARMIL